MQIAYNTISDWFVFFMRAKVVNYFMPCKFSFEFRSSMPGHFSPNLLDPIVKSLFSMICVCRNRMVSLN